MIQKISVSASKQEGADHFVGQNPEGLQITLDGNKESGKGVTPLECLLLSVAGCSGADVVDFLKNENDQVSELKIDVSGWRDKSTAPAPIQNIAIDYIVIGEVRESKLKRAVSLSIEKYCAVLKSLNTDVNLDYTVHLNGEKLEIVSELKEI
ncbi:OsmC family protein [Halocola ammonii]